MTNKTEPTQEQIDVCCNALELIPELEELVKKMSGPMPPATILKIVEKVLESSPWNR